MKIIAIDPGNEKSAFVVFESFHSFKEEIEIKDKGWINNQEMFQVIRDYRSLHNDSEFAIEMIACYGMPVGKEVFDTTLWIGRFYETVLLENYKEPHLVYRKDVKMHLCHTMKAKDGNIRQALIDKYGPPGVKKNPGITYGLSGDMWSALAVGVTFWENA